MSKYIKKPVEIIGNIYENPEVIGGAEWKTLK